MSDFEIGKLTAKVESLESAVKGLTSKIDEISDYINEGKGRRAVWTILAGILGAGMTTIIQYFKSP